MFPLIIKISSTSKPNGQKLTRMNEKLINLDNTKD
jgi:hypothetical protein